MDTPAPLDPDVCYRALQTHDSRFDGVFFVGVSSTRIYCRPICPARLPKRENCTFYISAAAAECAGYRPCLRCRPELAPGSARIDAIDRLAGAIASRIEDGVLTAGSVDALAKEMGVSSRHLRRVTETAFGVSPIDLAQTQRLLLAKRLLTDTQLPITEIALASGFSSLRRFNALFLERYRLNPTALRRAGAGVLAETLVSEIGYRPPLDWPSLLQFLDARAICGVEAIEGDTYRRTLAFGKERGWIAVAPSPRKNTLRVEVSASLARVIPATLAGVRRMFDLSASPESIASHLGPVAEANPGLRVPGAFNGFELTVRAILGQQISVRAATTLAGRFAARFGEPFETPFAGLTRLTPTAAQIAGVEPEEIVALGILASRARTLVALARAVEDGSINLSPSGDVFETMACLKSLPGIGEWTAQYVAMRALAWPDAFPHSDLALLKALNLTDPKIALQTAESWRPWRSYAAMHLWKSLEKPQCPNISHTSKARSGRSC